MATSAQDAAVVDITTISITIIIIQAILQMRTTLEVPRTKEEVVFQAPIRTTASNSSVLRHPSIGARLWLRQCPINNHITCLKACHLSTSNRLLWRPTNK